MLQKSNVDPNVYAYDHIDGQHDYMRHPWTPVRCPLQLHEPVDKMKIWDKHTMPGCFRKYISNTRAEIVSDTVFFKHKYLTQPTINPEDAVMTATKELNNTILCTVPQDHAQYKALKNI